METKIGKVEKVSSDGHSGIKISGTQGWLNLKGEALAKKPFIAKGDEVEYSEDGTFIKQLSEKSKPKEENLEERAGLSKEGQIVLSSALDAQDIYDKLDKDFREKIGPWNTVINQIVMLKKERM